MNLLAALRHDVPNASVGFVLLGLGLAAGVMRVFGGRRAPKGAALAAELPTAES